MLKNYSVIINDYNIFFAYRLFSVPIPPVILNEKPVHFEFETNHLEKQESAEKFALKNKKTIQEYNREYHFKNKEKRQQRKLEYNLKNKEKIQEIKREYYSINKEKIQDTKRDYYLNNKKKILEYSRDRYLNNKERELEYKRDHYSKNKEKMQEYNRKRYLKKKEKMQGYNREHYLKNKEKLQEYYREYNVKNKEKMQGYNREHYLKNKEKIQENNRQYISKNKDKLQEYKRKYNLKKRKGKTRKKIAYTWSNKISLRKFFDYVATLLYVYVPSDWYRISNYQIKKSGGRGLFLRYRTLGEALNFAYPEEPWDLAKFHLRGRKSSQRWLLVQMKQLLPNEAVVEDHNHPCLFWDSGKPVQLDVFVPRFNLALEYQGEQHYMNLHFQGSGTLLDDVVTRDNEKIQLCEKNGITLIPVPYWWDGTSASLASTLALHLPTYFSKTESELIPSTPPPNFKKG